MTGLIRYDAARAALEEAVRIDEVLDIRAQSTALEAYARMAKDKDLIDKATTIKLRAERKAGQLLIAMSRNGERRGPKDGSPKDIYVSQGGTHTEQPKTLDDLGITRQHASKWSAVAMLPEDDFEKRVSEAQKKATDSVEMSAREKLEAKQERRANRERELGAKQKALPQKKYGVVLADPAWDFAVWDAVTGGDRGANNHYETNDLAQILKLDVPSICHADCVLFLWATAPMMPQALQTMEAWGFEYKSQYVWVKDRAGTGYWSRNMHELLLIGTKGDVPCPSPGTQYTSVIEAPLGEHSEKPAIFLEMIEDYFPTVQKIELNRRGPARPNWDAWGTEAEVVQCG